MKLRDWTVQISQAAVEVPALLVVNLLKVPYKVDLSASRRRILRDAVRSPYKNDWLDGPGKLSKVLRTT